MEATRLNRPIDDGIAADQAYGFHGEQPVGIGIRVEHDNGAQEMGRQAAAKVLAQMMGREREPQRPQDRAVGITYRHEDGAIDTGTRAVRNLARDVIGQEPKKYRRTYVPIDRQS